MFWIALFALTAALMSATLVELVSTGDIPFSVYFDLPFLFFLLVGSFGLAFRVPLGTKRFWQYGFFILAGWGLIHGATLLLNPGSVPEGAAVVTAMLLPLFLMPWWYAFRSDLLWREERADAVFVARWLWGRALWGVRWVPPVIFVTIAWSLVVIAYRWSKGYPEWEKLASDLGLKYHPYSYMHPGMLTGRIEGFDVSLHPAAGEISVDIDGLDGNFRNAVIRTGSPDGPPSDELNDFTIGDRNFNWLFKTRRAHPAAHRAFEADDRPFTAMMKFMDRFSLDTLKLEYSYGDLDWASTHGGLERNIRTDRAEALLHGLLGIARAIKEAGRPRRAMETGKAAPVAANKKTPPARDRAGGMVCPGCGAENPSRFNFCGACGKKLR
ncbi:MAG TPA: zinc ribbon domain-containing protein [Spirochaetes bacterium]|nr:zinc ribbon domain-containing protein [Spirochaetota bacterium]